MKKLQKKTYSFLKRYLLWTIVIFSSFSTKAQNTEDTLRVGYTPASPFIIEENNQLSGVSVWLWEQCAKELKLNYQLIPMEFSPMLDSLKTGGIDLSINPLTINSSRMKDMDFTYTFFPSYSIVTVYKNSRFSQLKSIIRSFFSINFLSGFIVLLFLISLFGILIWVFEKRINEEVFRKGYKGIWDGIWWSVVTITTIGYGDKTPKTRGGKFIALLWMFGGLFIISGLTASIASTLTVDRMIQDRSSDFSEYKDRKIGTIEFSSSQQYLRGHFFRNLSLYKHVNEGLDALDNGEIDAFVYDEAIVKYRLLNDKQYENLVVLPKKFGVQLYAFALPKRNNEFKDLLSQKMIAITERMEWNNVLVEFGCIEE